MGDRQRQVRAAEAVLCGDLPDTSSLHLAAKLFVSIEGLSPEETLRHVQETENICPYTKAKLKATLRELVAGQDKKRRGLGLVFLFVLEKGELWTYVDKLRSG